ncbi:MAG: hypothetical protein N3B14_09735 [Thermoleophilia bacterium]|nr:hypothetical protein [Thermoleophilia bacterium]
MIAPPAEFGPRSWSQAHVLELGWLAVKGKMTKVAADESSHSAYVVVSTVHTDHNQTTST